MGSRLCSFVVVVVIVIIIIMQVWIGATRAARGRKASLLPLDRLSGERYDSREKKPLTVIVIVIVTVIVIVIVIDFRN